MVSCSSSWCLTNRSGSYFPVPGVGSAAEASECIRVVYVLSITVLGSVFSDPNWLQTKVWAVIIPSITVLFPKTWVGPLHKQGSSPGMQRPHGDPTLFPLLAQASGSSLLQLLQTWAPTCQVCQGLCSTDRWPLTSKGHVRDGGRSDPADTDKLQHRSSDPKATGQAAHSGRDQTG